MTPFAAYITLKKSVQLDKFGSPASPSPPVILLLQQANRELALAQKENVQLSSALKDLEEKFTSVVNINSSLLLKIESAEKDLEVLRETNKNLMCKLECKDTNIAKLDADVKDLGIKLKLQKKEYKDYVTETNIVKESFIKEKKIKEKEIYNVQKTLSNYQDTLANSKAEISKLKVRDSKFVREINKLEKKITSIESRKKLSSVSCQTAFTTDTPYTITAPLPPIFGSQLCVLTKQTFLSKSLPNLSTLIFVEHTEEDRIRDAAEEALNHQYDLEIENFYLEAREKALRLQEVYNENAIGMLFEPT